MSPRDSLLKIGNYQSWNELTQQQPGGPAQHCSSGMLEANSLRSIFRKGKEIPKRSSQLFKSGWRTTSINNYPPFLLSIRVQHITCIVIVIYCCFNIQHLKITKMYYLTQFLRVGNLGSIHLGGSASGSFTRLQSNCHLGLQKSQVVTGAGGSSSKMAPSCSCWQEASVPHRMGVE